MRTNLKDVSEEELSRAAAQGLIREMSPRVQLITNKVGSASVPGVARKEMFEGGFAYLRIGEISSNLSGEFLEAWKSVASTNPVRGVVLDLRYAGGLAYQEAARTADQFVGGNQELAKIGDAVMRSSASPEDIKVPLVVLINGETTGAAEVLAAILREQNAAILIGARTAGQARLFEKVKLSSGEELLVGKEPVEVAKGSKIAETGLAPDIGVEVEPQYAKTWYEDPYRNLSPVFAGSTNAVTAATGTNRVRRALNEAELVRRHREGTILEEEGGDPRVGGQPVVMDPMLARALDFLKGVATLKQLRPL